MAEAKLPLTLALSGGGARGAAHAGVLQVLAEERYAINAIAGVSVGGLVAVLHALHYTPLQIRNYIADTQLLEVWEVDTTRRAMFGSEKIKARLHTMIGDKTFADLEIPITLIAADLYNGREVHLREGSLLEALIASMAVPGVISPQMIGTQMLVDGGIVNPLPVNVARQMGQCVVAVDLGAHNPSTENYAQLFEARGPMQYATEIAKRLQVAGIMETAHQASVITSERLIELTLVQHPPDVLIRPTVGQLGLFAFDRADDAYQQGVAATRAQRPLLATATRAPTWWQKIKRQFRK